MELVAKQPFTEVELNRRFESALKQASVSLPALHGVLDKMGAPRNGETAVSQNNSICKSYLFKCFAGYDGLLYGITY